MTVEFDYGYPAKELLNLLFCKNHVLLRNPVYGRATVWAVLVLSLTSGGTLAQKSPALTAPDSAKSAAAEFTAAADEVLAQMSEITGLKLHPS